MLEPYLADPDLTLYQGDALAVLRELPDRSVHMACTSPPFWNLRDYQAEGQIGLEPGTSERGVCPECGAPWVREVAETAEYTEWKEREKQGWAKRSGDLEMGRGTVGTGTNSATVPTKFAHLGWQPSCKCDYHDTTEEELVFRPHPPIPATILDPFSGSGTSLLVARQLGRHAIGIELNSAYCSMTKARTRQQSLLAEASA